MGTVAYLGETWQVDNCQIQHARAENPQRDGVWRDGPVCTIQSHSFIHDLLCHLSMIVKLLFGFVSELHPLVHGPCKYGRQWNLERSPCR